MTRTLARWKLFGVTDSVEGQRVAGRTVWWRRLQALLLNTIVVVGGVAKRLVTERGTSDLKGSGSCLKARGSAGGEA